jgi:hypothetical protein
MRLTGIVVMPEQQRSRIAIENRMLQLRQPLRPQRKTAPPHGHNLRIRIDCFRCGSNHASGSPSCRPFAQPAGGVIEGNIESRTRGAPCQQAAYEAAADNGYVRTTHR